MTKSKGMDSKTASTKKKKGHLREDAFAKKIEGFVCKSQTCKKDVVDKDGITYSVKGGRRLQIFLYTKKRFMQNTEFKSFKLTPYFIMCFYDDTRKEAMKLLQTELSSDENIRKAFISKAFFNSNEVDKMVFFDDNDNDSFIFDREDVVKKISSLKVVNSKGNKKVVFKNTVIIGEFEYRADKKCLLFVFNKNPLLELLKT